MSLKIAQDTKIIPGSSGSRFVFSHACKGDARSRRYPDFLNITFLFSTQTLISSYACNIRGARTHHCPHFNEAAFRSDPNTFPVSLAGRVDRFLWLVGQAGYSHSQHTPKRQSLQDTDMAESTRGCNPPVAGSAVGVNLAVLLPAPNIECSPENLPVKAMEDLVHPPSPGFRAALTSISFSGTVSYAAFFTRCM